MSAPIPSSADMIESAKTAGDRSAQIERENGFRIEIIGDDGDVALAHGWRAARRFYPALRRVLEFCGWAKADIDLLYRDLRDNDEGMRWVWATVQASPDGIGEEWFRWSGLTGDTPGAFKATILDLC